jgi:hypothetical protein
MDINQKIEAFLNDQLGASERLAFEEEIQNNPELAKEVELMTDIHAGIKTFGKNQTKNIIANVAQAYHAEQVNDTSEAPSLKEEAEEVDHSINWGRWALYIALLAAVAIASFFIMFNEPTPKTAPELYAAYFEPYIPPSGQRSGELIGYDLKGMANKYRAEKYDELISQINNIPSEKTTNYMRILLAQSYMGKGTYVLAKPIFEEIIFTKDPYFADHAKWFLALNHLKLREQDSAKSILEDLTKDKGADHYEEAVELLRELGEE